MNCKKTKYKQYELFNSIIPFTCYSLLLLNTFIWFYAYYKYILTLLKLTYHSLYASVNSFPGFFMSCSLHTITNFSQLFIHMMLLLLGCMSLTTILAVFNNSLKFIWIFFRWSTSIFFLNGMYKIITTFKLNNSYMWMPLRMSMSLKYTKVDIQYY